MPSEKNGSRPLYDDRTMALPTIVTCNLFLQLTVRLFSRIMVFLDSLDGSICHFELTVFYRLNHTRGRDHLSQ